TVERPIEQTIHDRLLLVQGHAFGAIALALVAAREHPVLDPVGNAHASLLHSQTPGRPEAATGSVNRSASVSSHAHRPGVKSPYGSRSVMSFQTGVPPGVMRVSTSRSMALCRSIGVATRGFTGQRARIGPQSASTAVPTTFPNGRISPSSRG